jgi:zinc-ribbon domain
MIAAQCPNCGEPVAALARSCPRCGARNRRRPAAFAIIGSLLVLLVAIGVASFAVLRWQQLPVGTAERAATATSAEFGWLSAAMSDCESDAAKAPSTLHFLVIPLAAASPDDPEWRNKSLNDLGNAILLPSGDARAALESGALSISSEQYVFSVRDDATNTIYKWSASSGVKRFSAPDADSIEGFKIQFLTGNRTQEDQWGVSFTRRKGSCYWVNAIIGASD